MPTPTRSRRRRGALVAFFLAVSAALVVAGPQQQASPPPSQAPAQFKAGTNFVRVDAYPTHDGVPVEDLTADDFRITEDGVAQKIERFEHISSIRPRRGSASNPDRRAAAAELVADPHRRVFVIFLDTGGVHVDAHNIKEPLIKLLTNMLGPTIS